MLAALLRALHVAAPDDAPTNLFRGVPVADRRPSVREISDHLLDTSALEVYEAGAGAAAAPDSVWLHGDLHPRNIVVADGRLAAILDWGDLCAGDRATDLAVAWWLLDLDHHEAFWSAYGDITTATWLRARAWAAFFGLAFMNYATADDASAADPEAHELGRRLLARVVATQGPPPSTTT